jgi:hypothetical protein
VNFASYRGFDYEKNGDIMTSLKSVTDEVKAESQQLLSELQTLRDEIKLKLHLASAERRDAWDKLEPEVERFERKLSDAAESAATELKAAGADLKADLENVYKSIKL